MPRRRSNLKNIPPTHLGTKCWRSEPREIVKVGSTQTDCVRVASMMPLRPPLPSYQVTFRISESALDAMIYSLNLRLSNRAMRLELETDNSWTKVALLTLMKKLFPNPVSQVTGVYTIDPLGLCWSFNERITDDYLCRCTVIFSFQDMLTPLEVSRCINMVLTSFRLPTLSDDDSPITPAFELQDLAPRVYFSVIPPAVINITQLTQGLNTFCNEIRRFVLCKTGKPINEIATPLPQATLPPARSLGLGFFNAGLSGSPIAQTPSSISSAISTPLTSSPMPY